MVVSNVYTTACPKIRPVSFLAPSIDNVVITAKDTVGIAMNWNKRVKTAAIKLKSSFRAGMCCHPKIAPMMRAPIHKMN